MRRIHGFALILILSLLLGAVGSATRSAHAQDSGPTIHTVQLGETLYSIARRYGVSAEAIAEANGIVNPDYIYAGQSLRIPGGGPGYPAPHHPSKPGTGGYGRHVVALGETLYGIAWRYGVSVSAIMAANGLSNPDYIYAGQALSIPGGSSEPAPGGWVEPGPVGKPGCGGRHWVKPGETLSGIAWAYGQSVQAIAWANSIPFPYVIYAGASLHIPCGEHHHPPKHAPSRPGAPRPRATDRPSLQPATCAREVQIVQPRQNERLTGTVTVVGTASIPDFQFYKLEVAMGAAPLDGNFFSIGPTHNEAISDSALGTWYVGNLPAGTYTLRLTAVDNRGQFPRPCNVTVHIDR